MAADQSTLQSAVERVIARMAVTRGRARHDLPAWIYLRYLSVRDLVKLHHPHLAGASDAAIDDAIWGWCRREADRQ